MYLTPYEKFPLHQIKIAILHKSTIYTEHSIVVEKRFVVHNIVSLLNRPHHHLNARGILENVRKFLKTFARLHATVLKSLCTNCWKYLGGIPDFKRRLC